VECEVPFIERLEERVAAAKINMQNNNKKKLLTYLVEKGSKMMGCSSCCS
jgi:hypothetical protein